MSHFGYISYIDVRNLQCDPTFLSCSTPTRNDVGKASKRDFCRAESPCDGSSDVAVVLSGSAIGRSSTQVIAKRHVAAPEVATLNVVLS